MGTAKEQRAAATRERRRKEQRVRAEARSSEQRTARAAASEAADPNPLRVPWPIAARWSPLEAWLSEDADGASHHHLGLVRGEGEARAAVFWRADAHTGAIDEVVRLSGVSEDRVNAEIVRRAQTRPLLSAEPEDAAAAWIDATLLRAPAPRSADVGAVEAFLGGLDADAAITRLRWGQAGQTVAKPAPGRSWWQRLLGG
ncbi:MAG: hypothetical protein RLZZ383_2044 [Pseudomonadota bacterium]|jgi:hypothetical protein